MSTEENKALVRRFYEEVWNHGHLERVDDLFAADYIERLPPPHTLGHGPEDVKQVVSQFRSALPDIQFSIDDQLADGDKVVIRWTFRGTQRGMLLGIAPTGKPVVASGITIARLAGGKIVEIWANWDVLGLQQQLGVSPVPEQTSA